MVVGRRLIGQTRAMVKPSQTPQAAAAPTPSIQWPDIALEACIYLGAGAAIIRQLANPAVGLGVARHSSALQDPMPRLYKTMDYIYVVALGSDRERRIIAREVDQAHKPVRSQYYDAFDPQLQLWVAATLYKGGIEVYELMFGRLDQASREHLLQQAAVYGTTLQMPPALWPADSEAFEHYWDRALAGFDVPAEVRDYVHALLEASAAPWYIKALMPVQSLATRALLGPSLRRKFELPWSRRDEFLWRWFMRIAPPVYRLLPIRLRYLPARWHLRRWRKRRGLHPRQ